MDVLTSDIFEDGIAIRMTAGNHRDPTGTTDHHLRYGRELARDLIDSLTLRGWDLFIGAQRERDVLAASLPGLDEGSLVRAERLGLIGRIDAQLRATLVWMSQVVHHLVAPIWRFIMRETAAGERQWRFRDVITGKPIVAPHFTTPSLWPGLAASFIVPVTRGRRAAGRTFDPRQLALSVGDMSVEHEDWAMIPSAGAYAHTKRKGRPS